MKGRLRKCKKAFFTLIDPITPKSAARIVKYDGYLEDKGLDFIEVLPKLRAAAASAIRRTIKRAIIILVIMFNLYGCLVIVKRPHFCDDPDPSHKDECERWNARHPKEYKHRYQPKGQ